MVTHLAFTKYRCLFPHSNVTYDLQYYSQNGSCAGTVPSVELAARNKRNGSSGFDDWYMLRYHTGAWCTKRSPYMHIYIVLSARQLHAAYVDCAGNCSSNEISSGRLLLEEGSELQVRLVLSPGPPCSCILMSNNFTFSTGLSVT